MKSEKSKNQSILENDNNKHFKKGNTLLDKYLKQISEKDTGLTNKNSNFPSDKITNDRKSK